MRRSKPIPIEPGTQRAVMYARVSTGMQERDGVSLDQQMDMARRFCELRGFVLVETYVDTMTGTNDARPGLARLESDLTRRAFDHVLVYKIDRLSRDQAHYHRLLQDFERQGVGLASLTQPIDATSAIGKVILTILIALAQYESEQTGDRIRDSIAFRAQQGRIIAGHQSPLGFRYHKAFTDGEGVRRPGRYEVDEAEAAVVRWIFATYLRHRSIVKVVDLARKEGVFGRNGRPLVRSWVQNVLENPAYKGDLVACKRRTVKQGGKKVTVPVPPAEWIRIEGALPALVDAKDWQAAQDQLALNAVTPSARIAGREKYAWSGVLTCGSCGHKLGHAFTPTGKDHARTLGRYLCSGRVQNGKTYCARPAAISEGFLDHVVAPRMLAVAERGLKKARRGKELKVKAAPTGLDVAGELGKLVKRKQKLKDLYELTDLTIDEYRAKVAEIDGRIAELHLHQQAMATQAAAPTLPANLKETWARYADDPGQRNRLLEALAARIMVDGTQTVRVEFHANDDLPGWPTSIEVPVIHMMSKEGRRARGLPPNWSSWRVKREREAGSGSAAK